MLRSLALTNIYPIADTREVFKGDPASGAFGLLDDALRDGVVDIGAEPGIQPGETFEMFLGTARAARLQRGAKFQKTLSDGFDVCAAVRFTVRVGGDTNDAEVFAEELAPEWPPREPTAPCQKRLRQQVADDLIAYVRDRLTRNREGLPRHLFAPRGGGFLTCDGVVTTGLRRHSAPMAPKARTPTRTCVLRQSRPRHRTKAPEPQGRDQGRVPRF